jgi:Zn-finger nucleic acid-binding protein
VRGGYLVCPGCGGAMQPYDLGGDDGVVVSRCQECQGVWFDWFDGETSRLAHGMEQLAGQHIPEMRPGGSCPRDGVVLEGHPYLDAGPKVARCPQCLGLFAGRSQLAALADFHERIPASPEPIERTSLLARLWYAFGR